MQAHEHSFIAASAAAAGAARRPNAGIGWRTGVATLGFAALLAGCAGPKGPNEDIERARAEVDRVATMPVVTRYAPLELKEASDTVEQAARQWHDKGDTVEARHRAYLATERAAIARNFALARDAEEKMKQANATADRQRLEARSQEAAAARQEASQQAQRASAADARVRDLEGRLKDIQAQQTERGLLVTLGDVLFETGKSQLLAPAMPKLDKLAGFLRQYPDRRLMVEGYTDSTGSASTNMTLSQRRAESVKRALVERGVQPWRVMTRGYGANFPVADNATSEGRALNRRVEVVIGDEHGSLRPRN